MISYYSFIQDLSYTYGSDISATGWKRSANGTRMAYDFSYDGLHRLKNATLTRTGNQLTSVSDSGTARLYDPTLGRWLSQDPMADTC